MAKPATAVRITATIVGAIYAVALYVSGGVHSGGCRVTALRDTP